MEQPAVSVKIFEVRMFNYRNINDDKNYAASSDFMLCPITNVLHKNKMINVINL
jgi:hypothetical protein